MRVYGINVLYELDKKKIKRVYTYKKDICQYCKENNIRFEFVDKSFFKSFSNTSHQGVIIDIYDYEYYSLSDIKGDFILVLDHLEDPHNFGAIIRTCAAVGIKSIIIPKDRSVKVSDIVYKTSVGTINYVDIIMVNNLVNAINYLKDKGYFIYATSVSGEDFRNVDYNDKKVLIIGNEGKGVSKLVQENSDLVVSIPINKNVESLNASVAAAILIYGISKYE